MVVKNVKGIVKWVQSISSIAGGIALGGLFTTGSTLTYPILSIFPYPTLHMFIGWVIIIGGVIQALKFLDIL